MPIYSKCSGLTSKSNKFTVAAGETTTKEFVDTPQSDPVGVLLGKVDKTTNANKPQGSTSLDNAQFSIYCDFECHHC